MYGKIFASAFTGSMYGAGPDVFAVWSYVIATTVDSQVELNPNLLAGILGASVEQVQAAIDYLCAPDPASRSKIADGRRLIREGAFAYRVPNFATYRAIRNEEERREYNRLKKAEQRSRDKVKVRVNDCQRKSSMSANTETEAETETETEAGGGGGGEIGTRKTTTTATSWEKVPQEYHPDLQALEQSSPSKTAFRIELQTLLNGKHPDAEGCTPTDVGRAAREVALAGAPSGKLARFTRFIMKRRAENGAHGEPEDEWDRATRLLIERNRKKREVQHVRSAD